MIESGQWAHDGKGGSKDEILKRVQDDRRIKSA